MRSRILFLLAIASSVMAGDVGDIIKQRLASQALIAEQIETWPISKTQFFLYTLDPRGGFGDDVNTKRVFHGFKILRKAQVTTEEDKAAILKAFALGVRESDGSLATCFNPRHGLRLVVGSSTNDFTICFECLSVMPYGFNDGHEFLIAASPNATFNNFVHKYHLKKAKKYG
jgi:hypothetical protein